MPDSDETPDKPPKAFISYSWTSPGHQNQIREWADQLMSEGGVEIILDQYDLKEGQDKYAFMEQMVTDPSVTHVLVFSDKAYSEKADKRRAGVGTESQIISREIYEKTDQTKFIPIVCEMSDSGEPFLPTYTKGRIWIDFSSPESVNENWERLVRALHGKPLYEKPQLGKPPAYITTDERVPVVPAAGKFATLKLVIMQGRGGVGLYRSDFLTTCIEFADSFRIRKQPDPNSLAEKTLVDFAALVPVRNYLVDWVMLEASTRTSEEFSEALNGLLEKLLEVASRPAEVTQWNDGWFAAMGAFVCETFIYIIAALLKRGAYDELRSVFAAAYLIPETDIRGDKRFQTFESFYGQCGIVGKVLTGSSGQTFYSPTAELFKRQAKRPDIDFKSVMEADALIFLMSVLQGRERWYPQTLVYASWSTSFPFFIRATQHKGFLKLARITGLEEASVLREKAQIGLTRFESSARMGYGYRSEISLLALMNLENLDTEK